MKILELNPIPPILVDNQIRFSCRLIRRNSGDTESVNELWYEIPKEIDISWKNEDVEPYLIATILQAMYEERRVVAKGSVSAELLSNLTEFCDFWNNCLPELFKRIDVGCESIEREERARPVNKAIAAFSGGLDATFLVWRHIKKQAGYRTQPLSCCSLIHGLDISLSNTEFFNMSFARAQKTLETVGLPLIPIRTNVREILVVPLAYAHGTVLVSSFQFLKSKYGIVLIAGSMPYVELVFPWGTSPLTDHLLSSSRLRVLHDGASYSRPEKVKGLSEWMEGLSNIRVCLDTEHIRSLNCGRCEKCVRTMACFAANGLPIPECLNGDLDVLNERIKSFRFHSPAHRSEWINLMKEAKRNGIRDPWVKWIPRLMVKYEIRKIRNRMKQYFRSKFRGVDR